MKVFEKIVLSNGLQLAKVILPGRGKAHRKNIHLFIPDLTNLYRVYPRIGGKENNLIDPDAPVPINPYLFNNSFVPGKAETNLEVQKRKLDYQKDLVYNYYLFNLLEFEDEESNRPQKKRKNPLNRHFREFSPGNLFYMEELNPAIREEKLQNKWDVIRWLRELSPNGRDIKLKKIIDSTVSDRHRLRSMSIKRLINNAFYESPKENPFLDDAALKMFADSELQRTQGVMGKLRLGNNFKMDKNDYEFIEKKFSQGHSVQLLLTDSKIMEIVSELKKMSENWKHFEINVRKGKVPGGLVEENRKTYLKNGHKLLDSLKESLIKKNEMSRDKGLQELLQAIITSVEDIQNSSEYPDLMGLYSVRNIFDVIDGTARKYLLYMTEPVVRVIIRDSMKKALKQLIKEENLSRAEIRLFILHNIGVPALNFKTPFFEVPLYYFFNYHPDLLDMFKEVVLKKNYHDSDTNLGEELEIYFKGYLRFYKAYVEISRNLDNEDKKRIRHRGESISYNDLSNTSEKNRDAKIAENGSVDTENPAGPEEETIEDQSGGTEDTSTEESNVSASSIYNAEVEIRDPDESFESSIINRDMIEFIQRVLSKEDFDILYSYFIEGATDKEIAARREVSVQAIQKRRNKIMKNIKKILEIEFGLRPE